MVTWKKSKTIPIKIAGTRNANRVTITLGKISVLDIFDNNPYAGDPRSEFMNWALMANGAWDYPADTRGYTGSGGGLSTECLVGKSWIFPYARKSLTVR